MPMRSLLFSLSLFFAISEEMALYSTFLHFLSSQLLVFFENDAYSILKLPLFFVYSFSDCNDPIWVSQLLHRRGKKEYIQKITIQK